MVAVGATREVVGPTEYDVAAARLSRGEDIHYSGASSTMEYDELGEIKSPSLIWHIQGNEFRTVQTYSEDDIAGVLAADGAGACP